MTDTTGSSMADYQQAIDDAVARLAAEADIPVSLLDGAAGREFYAWLEQRNAAMLTSARARFVRLIGGHLVRWSPRRVLAECEAKQRIIEAHTDDGHGDCRTCVTPVSRMEYPEEWDPESNPCPTLRLLALPYVDRPGYRPEWRPE